MKIGLKVSTTIKIKLEIMGMNTRGTSGSNKTYLGVYQNQLVLEYDKLEDLEKKVESLGLDIDKIQERKRTKGKNEGKPVYYFVIYDVDGLLTNIRINETDWGDFVEVEITDVDEKYVISLGDVFSRSTKDLIRRLDNINLSEEMVFKLWSMTKEETGKSARSGVTMYQNDEKVEYAISYDDMPAPEQKKKGRKVEWDYSEQETFLYDALVDFIADNFKSEIDSEKERLESDPLPSKKEPVANAEEEPKKRSPRGAKAATDKGVSGKKKAPF